MINTANKEVAAFQRRGNGMGFSSLRIGYVPYDLSLQMPGDRYRFCHYAKRRNIEFEIADPSEQYDLLVVSSGADVSLWSRYAKRCGKLVFQYINSSLVEPRLSPKRVLRGTAKFVLRQNRHLLFDYSSGIRAMCRMADAVVCASIEQREQVSEYCDNVHVVLDSYEYLIRSAKNNYKAGACFNFVWQGFPENIRFFAEIKDVLKRIQKKRQIAFHLITNLEYGRYLGRKIGKRNALQVARCLLDNVHVYSWNEDICSSIITGCDLALVPLPLHDPVESGKPENKLLLFWRLGMPTVVSSTPAYSRVMRQCGIAMDCRTEQEWETVLSTYIADEDARREMGQKGKVFAEAHFGEEKILQQWDAVFSSVLASDEREIMHASMA